MINRIHYKKTGSASLPSLDDTQINQLTVRKVIIPTIDQIIKAQNLLSEFGTE